MIGSFNEEYLKRLDDWLNINYPNLYKAHFYFIAWPFMIKNGWHLFEHTKKFEYVLMFYKYI